MHYGTMEKFSVKFYEEACSEMTMDRQEAEEEAKPRQQGSRQPTHDCCICDLSTCNKRSLLIHLTLHHFSKKLCDDLPKKFPFSCPFLDCCQRRHNLHGLMLHYGVDHVISMKLYKKHPMYREARAGLSAAAGETARATDTDGQSPSGAARVELPAATPRPNKLQAVVTPYHPEIEEKGGSASPASQNASPAAEVGSSTSGTGTISSARARILKTWQTGTLETYKKTMEEMEAKMRDMEAAHKEKLKEKEKDFGRWLALKESKLEAEVSRRQTLEVSLSEKDLNIADLTAQLELVHANFSRVEEDLEVKKRLCEDLLAYKEDSVRELQIKEQERLNSYEELYQKDKQMEAVEEKLKERESHIEQLAHQIQDKEKELAEVETSAFRLQNSLSKVSAEFEQKNKPTIKVVITQDGFTSRSDKFKTMSIEAAAAVEDKDTQEPPWTKERKSLKESFSEMQASIKGFYELFVEKEQDVSELEQRVRESEFKAKDLESKTDVLKSLEKENKDLMKKVKGLETTLGDWETRQFTNLKLIAGLEKERNGLQDKLKELKDGNLSHEDQLYWKDVAIKNKEKEAKSLKTGLEEKEVKLAELGKEVGAGASQIKKLKEKCTQLDKMIDDQEQAAHKKLAEVEELKKQDENHTNEIKHLKIALSQKTKELSSINTTAVCQKAELDRLMREHEKCKSEYRRAITQLKVVKNSENEMAKKMNKLEAYEKRVQFLEAKLADLMKREKEREGERVELEWMNQVLSDMDRVIEIQTRESQSGERILKQWKEAVSQEFQPQVFSSNRFLLVLFESNFFYFFVDIRIKHLFAGLCITGERFFKL